MNFPFNQILVMLGLVSLVLFSPMRCVNEYSFIIKTLSYEEDEFFGEEEETVMNSL